MKQNFDTEELKLLEKIQRMEVSPFLLTRIRQRIANETKSYVQTRWAVVSSVGLALLLAMNFYVITKAEQPASQTSQRDIAAAMHMETRNSLYGQ